VRAFLERNQIASLIIATTAASLVSAWVLAATNGSAGLFGRLFSVEYLPRLLAAIAVIAAGSLLTYAVLRLARVSANVMQTGARRA
jgi:hypothetical protein